MLRKVFVGFLLIAAFFVLMMSSCEKESAILPPVTDLSVGAAVPNSMNAYDTAGMLIIRGSDSLIRRVFLRPQFYREDVMLEARFVVQDFFASDSFPFTTFYNSNQAFLDGISSTRDYTTFLKVNDLDSLPRAWAVAMYDTLMEAKATGIGSDSLCVWLKGIEQELLNDSRIDSTKKAALLVSASAYRYSAAYWEKNAEVWRPVILSSGKSSCRDCRGWYEHCLETGKGALAGALAGSSGKAGCPNDYSGALPGGIYGGVGGSACRGLFE
jgi:hypothetical protein